MRNTSTDRKRSAFDSEMKRLRVDLNEWFWTQGLEDMPDEAWAETTLEELKSRGFVFIEKASSREVLVCLGRKGIVHVSRAPYRALAIARSIRLFANSATDAELLSRAGAAN